MEELVSLLRVHRSEKRLVGPEECHCKREKEPKISSCGSGRKKKAVPDPKKQKKRVWEIDFHESDPNRGKQIYITQKNMLLRV